MARIGLLAALMVAGYGCGADPCAGSPCPNDARQTQDQYNECVARHNAQKNKGCYSQNLNYELCIQGNVVCNSEGKADLTQTLSKANSACKAAQDAALCCAIGVSCK